MSLRPRRKVVGSKLPAMRSPRRFAPRDDKASSKKIMDIKSQLKNLKHAGVKPRSEWLQNNREVLLSQIRNTVSHEAKPAFKIESFWPALSIFLPQTFVYNFVRPVAVLLIVVMVGTSGWIATVDASYESLPGDWLYGVKRVGEKTQSAVVSMTGNKTADTRLHAEFAKRRAVEVKKIVASTDPSKKAKVNEAMADLKSEIKVVNANLDKAKLASSDVSAEVIKEVKTSADEVKAVLESVKDNLQTASSTDLAAANVITEVKEMKDLAKDTAVKAVGMIVDKHLAGDNTVTKEEVKKELDKTMASAASEITENKQNMDSVKIIIDSAVTEAKGFVADSKTTSSTVATSTAQDFSDKITNIASTTKSAAVQTDAAVTNGDKTMAEGKVLIGQNDLAGALSKVQELNTASKESEQIKDATLQTAQAILPITNAMKDAPLPITSPDVKIEVKIDTTTASSVSGTLPIQIIVTSTKATTTTSIKK